MNFIVSYDLNQPVQQYTQLWGALRALGGERILESVWAVIANGTAEGLRNHLGQYMDPNDRIIVIDVDTAEHAWSNLKATLPWQA